METINVQTKCPKCGESLIVPMDLPSEAVEMAGNVRSCLRPIGSIYVYKITSDDIKGFLTAKVRALSPETKIDVIPRYCEKKTKKGEPHRSYASLRIAFSHHAIEKKSDHGWFDKIGETGSNVRLVNDIFANVIQRYSFSRKNIDTWLGDYKILESLEDAFGITEEYLKDIRTYCVPQLVPTNNGDDWIIFAASAESVITDMLTDVDSNKVDGSIKIVDVQRISNDSVEFTVHLNPAETVLKEDPIVRQMLLGEKKLKK